ARDAEPVERASAAKQPHATARYDPLFERQPAGCEGRLDALLQQLSRAGRRRADLDRHAGPDQLRQPLADLAPDVWVVLAGRQLGSHLLDAPPDYGSVAAPADHP